MMPAGVSFTESLHSDIRQAFYEHHRLVARVMQVVLLLCPFVGIYLHGAVGGVLGVTVFLLGYYLAPYAWSAMHRRRPC
jgi:hypothetical protein